jgi:hypothetical protein
MPSGFMSPPDAGVVPASPFEPLTGPAGGVSCAMLAVFDVPVPLLQAPAKTRMAPAENTRCGIARDPFIVKLSTRRFKPPKSC